MIRLGSRVRHKSVHLRGTVLALAPDAVEIRWDDDTYGWSVYSLLETLR